MPRSIAGCCVPLNEGDLLQFSTATLHAPVDVKAGRVNRRDKDALHHSQRKMFDDPLHVSPIPSTTHALTNL